MILALRLGIAGSNSGKLFHAIRRRIGGKEPLESGPTMEPQAMLLKCRVTLDVRDENTAHEAASLASEFGFKASDIGKRGLSIEGSPELFENVFNAKVIVREGRGDFVDMPVIPPNMRASHVRSVYFPTPPIYFH